MDRVQVAAGSTFEDGAKAALQMLNEGCRPTAVQAVTDPVAIGCAETLLRQGLSIPGDVSVAGFGNIPAAEYYRVPLTTINQPKHRLGTAAVETIMNLIRGEKAFSRRLPAELIVRQSTAAPKAEMHQGA